ncbi:putative bifunctional diguanylate cyclase/phosphodiesterase [Marinobacter sp.]|uniref:putative bifunctional diguanylate cyclase/phosphodiesterase n=1 Tax=Marinobacter sp. TaxID=50741 RepID=UPI002B2764C9|nr:EAL domain-containing protein [Marinobacter sp.]
MFQSELSVTLDSSSTHSEAHRLLVVDDDLAVRMVSRYALEKSGFGVTDASDGFTALSWLKSHAFDAVLLDARMPGIDGFATCRQIRELLNDDSFPIIIATGQDDEDSVDAAFESGATDFATKPLNWRIITKRLNSLIGARAVKKNLNDRSHQISSMLKTSSEAMLVLDDNGVIQASHLLERLPSELSRNVTPGNRLIDCLQTDSALVVEQARAEALKGDSFDSFVVYSSQDGLAHTVQGRFIAGSENELICLLQDQSEAFVVEKQMFDLVHKDPSTGVANEKQLMSELRQRLRDGVETNTHSVLLRYSASDLRCFEPRIGRQGMGRLARTIVERLGVGVENFLLTREQISEPGNALIARLSDSDYIVVLSGLEEVGFADELADVLLRRVTAGIEIDGFTCSVEWAVGVADSIDSSATPDGILSATAYAIQSEGALASGRRIHRYNTELRERVCQDIEIERLLRRDIADGVLEMHYQPKFDLSGLGLIGMEALMRWTNSELGVVSPARFIPIAEKSGLIVSLSHVMVEKVLDQMMVWRVEDRKQVPVSINISGIHLNTRTIVQELQAGIKQRNIPPHLLELEVTESIMIDGTGKALKNLTDLRDMGVRVAIDDFGTGYSSLSYLRSLPIDCLKIDRSFVSSITTCSTAQAIAKAIITVGHDVNLHVIAEGVETHEQLECLTNLGCDSVQGYFTGRPVASAEFTRFFDSAD